MKKQRGNGGIGVLGLLGVVFVVWKLAGLEPIASWSWWWVTAPFWGGLALVLAVLGVLLLAGVAVTGYERLTRR